MRYVGPHGRPLSEFLSWDQADQDAALAWQDHEDRRCPGCGHNPADGPVHVHTVVCPVCADLAAQRAKAKDDPGAHVVVARGRREHCPTCTAEIQANRRG